MRVLPGFCWILLLWGCGQNAHDGKAAKADTSGYVSFEEGFYDTVLVNGTYLKFQVNKDTADANIYIRYGKRGFDSVFIAEECQEMPPCHQWKFFYATDRHIALIYACISTRGMALLPLNPVDSIEYGMPIFEDIVHKLLLVEEWDKYKNDGRQDTLTVADFDFERRQSFFVRHIVSATLFDGIDTVYLKNGWLTLRTGDRVERTRVPWIL